MSDTRNDKTLPIDAQWSRTKSFTRRSRALPSNLERVMDREAKNFMVEVDRGLGETTVSPNCRFNPDQSFGREAPLIVEIGSGTGDQIVAAAGQYPNSNFLSFEVWRPGIAKMISRAAQLELKNLRIIEADAQQALPILLADNTVQEIWTFFPDPWRKARHHKRRLVSPDFAAKVSSLLVDGGIWRLATDWDDYAWQMRDVVEGNLQLENPYAGSNLDPQDPQPERGGFAPRFSGRILTRFENRGIAAGRRVHDLSAVRLPRETEPPGYRIAPESTPDSVK